MSENSKIEWTDHTFNSWLGCTKVSPGCDHCYAEARMDNRLHIVNWGAGQPRKRTSAANWREPIKWNARHEQFFAEHGRRQRVFCASLADVFDNEVPGAWREDLFDLIRITPQLDWLLLTKRPQNIVRMVKAHGAIAGNGLRYLPSNIWLGATVTDQAEADRNIPHLLATKNEIGARVVFLSMEPLLGPVRLDKPNPIPSRHDEQGRGIEWIESATWLWRGGIDWVIVGGESGPNARPMNPDWARSLRDQCMDVGVPFLFKQWGEWHPWSEYPPGPDVKHITEVYWPDGNIGAGSASKNGGPGMHMVRVGKKAAGRELDGRTYDDFPEGR